MWHLVVAFALLTTPAASAEVTATKLDGTSLSGSLVNWTEGQVVIATHDGEQAITQSELLSLKWSSGRPQPTTQPFVELLDGTVLPAIEFRAFDKNCKFTLQQEAGSHPEGTQQGTGSAENRVLSTEYGRQVIEVPLQAVRAVRLQPLDAAVLGQWDEILAMDSPGDLLVILKQNGQSLDYLEGVVGEITDAEVEFTLENKSVRVQRPKVAGVVYYRGKPESNKETQCVLLGRYGMKASTSHIRLDGGNIQIETTSGVAFTWPMVDLHLADFSAGKLVFLSDLEPASDRWTPWVALPADASLAADFGRPRRDESSTGGSLTLSSSDDALAEPVAPDRQQSFDKGLAIRSRTELVYRLPRGFSRFLAVAGIEPATCASGDVQLLIEGDGRPLLDARVAGNQSPLPIELDVTGVKRLTIVVDYGDNLDTGDWLNLCNARIVK